MKIGFVTPNYPCEKRVALLPKDIDAFPDEVWIEQSFGKNLDVADAEYKSRGCTMAPRDVIFNECDTIFSLKLLQSVDYTYLRDHQMIIGWTHPTGSGRSFMSTQVKDKHLIVVDLDNTYPRLYYNNKSVDLECFPKNFLYKNSFNAGCAAIMHAFLTYGSLPKPDMKIAVLGNGNTAQGAFHLLSRFTDNIRMFYRKTLPEFIDNIGDYDVIVNGIELDVPDHHIITANDILRTKKNCLFIDAAADAGNTIETTHYTSIDSPVYKQNNRYFYVVNNTPSLIYRDTSSYLSSVFSKYILSPGIERFWRIAATLD